MPSSRARRLWPDALFSPPDFRRYSKESEKIFAIYREFTPLVQAVSIDEAYLDVTDHLGEAGSATALAREIRRLVREERGLTVSVGVGPNRLIAKIASDFNKPDGLTVVRPEKVQAFLDPLPVRRLHGVGPARDTRAGGHVGGGVGAAVVAEGVSGLAPEQAHVGVVGANSECVARPPPPTDPRAPGAARQ